MKCHLKQLTFYKNGRKSFLSKKWAIGKLKNSECQLNLTTLKLYGTQVGTIQRDITILCQNQLLT